jgi:hypothetical protein
MVGVIHIIAKSFCISIVLAGNCNGIATVRSIGEMQQVDAGRNMRGINEVAGLHTSQCGSHYHPAFIFHHLLHTAVLQYHTSRFLKWF